MAMEFPTQEPRPEIPPPAGEQTPPPSETPSPRFSPPPPPAPLQPLTQEEERTWAVVSHLSVLANLFTGLLGPVIPLVIYLVYRDRSRYVAFHAMQSLLMQLVLWIGGGILTAIAWVITGVLMAVIVGFCLLPIAIVISLAPLAALVYGIIGAVEVGQGHDFRYYMIANWADSILQSNV